MSKSIFTPLWCSVFLVLLFACSPQGLQSPTTSSSTRLPSATVIPTHTEPKPTPIPTEIPTFTPTPYPTKQVLLKYELRSSPRPPFHEFIGKAYPMLALYSDGQLIVTGETFQEKILTVDEKAQFLSQLEELGFYKIDSNQKHDPTDNLYNFGNNYNMEEIGSFYCVVTAEKAKDLCAYEPYRKFLVPEMKNILKFLDEYRPKGMIPYNPDRILIKVEAGRDPDIRSLPETALPWSVDFPSLASATNGTLYAEGKAAAEIFSLLGGKLTPNLVTQNGEEYTIEYARPVLPHEVISFP